MVEKKSNHAQNAIKKNETTKPEHKHQQATVAEKKDEIKSPEHIKTTKTVKVKSRGNWRMVISSVVVGIILGVIGCRIYTNYLANQQINLQTATATKARRNIKQLQKQYPNFDFPDKANMSRSEKADNSLGNAFIAVDTNSGVEYIVTSKGGITPRLDKHGRVMVVHNMKANGDRHPVKVNN